MNEKQCREEQWRDLFYETQREGADEFGNVWLLANNAVVQKCTGIFDVSLQQVRSLILLTILETLRVAAKENNHDIQHRSC